MSQLDFFTCSGTLAWKRLIDCTPAPDERISLIISIFSDRRETEEVKCLHGHDAQAFVDIMDEVLPTARSTLR